jgi:hypothetical protein
MEIVKGGKTASLSPPGCACICQGEDVIMTWEFGYEDPEHCACRCAPLASQWYFIDAWVYEI